MSKEHCFNVAFGSKASDPYIQQKALPVAELQELFSEHREGAKDGPYFVPAKFKKAYRVADNIATWSAAILDLDEQANASEDIIRERLKGLSYFAHTSHSHLEKAGVECWRVVLPYNQAVSPQVHAKVSRHLTKLFPGADTCSTKDLQFFFLPACPPERAALARSFHTMDEGELLHPIRYQSQLTQSPDIEIPPPTAEQMAGNHEDWIAELLQGDDLHGNMNSLVMRWVRRGWSDGEIYGFFEAARLRLEHERGDRVDELFAGELQRSIEGARKKIKSESEPPETSQLVPVNVSDLLTAVPKPPECVIEKWLPRGFVTLLGGHGGAGKTSLALAFSGHVACGKRFAGADVQQGRVLFISLEDGGHLMRFRLRNIIEEYDLDADQIAANVCLYDGSDGYTALITAATDNAPATLTNTYHETKRLAEGFDLVIIDNASDAFDANENSRRQVRSFISALSGVAKENNAAVMLLAHIDKSAARYGSNQNSYSGSTHWHNGPRSRLALILDESGDIALVHEKNNVGPKQAQLPLTLNDNGVIVPKFDLGAGGDFDDAEAEAAFLELFRQADAAGINISAKLLPGNGSATNCLENLEGYPKRYEGKTGRKHAIRILTRLLGQGALVQEEYYNESRKKKTRLTLPEKCSSLPP